MSWQPIKTAPLDTLVLVYDEIGVVPRFNSYLSDWPDDLVVHVLPAIRRKMWGVGEWQTIVAEYDFGVPSDPGFDASSVVIKPSYWRPMPEPPEDLKVVIKTSLQVENTSL